MNHEKSKLVRGNKKKSHCGDVQASGSCRVQETKREEIGGSVVLAESSLSLLSILGHQATHSTELRASMRLNETECVLLRS